MRRISLWFASTAVIVALLFGYHTSTSGVLAATSQAPITSGPSAGTTTASHRAVGAGTKPRASKTVGTKKTAAAKPQSYTGSIAQTRYGPLQVAIEVSGGSISKVSVLQYPHSSPTDSQINSYALPILVDQTTKAQSAQIQMVSGATYTSDGYLTSLQSALDQAGL